MFNLPQSYAILSDTAEVFPAFEFEMQSLNRSVPVIEFDLIIDKLSISFNTLEKLGLALSIHFLC